MDDTRQAFPRHCDRRANRNFRENGYLSIERITTDEEVAWLKGIYDQLFNRRMGEGEGGVF